MKIKYILLNTLVIFSITTQVFASSFKDVSKADWFYNDLETLSSKSVINGFADGTFKPYDSVTYGELLKMVVLAFNGEELLPNRGEHWAKVYSDKAIELGFIDEKVSDFDEKASRMYIAEVIYNVLDVSHVNMLSPYVDIDSDIANTLFLANIMEGSFDLNGNRTFLGDTPVTRAEISAILLRSIEFYENLQNTEVLEYALPEDRLTIDGENLTVADFENIYLYMLQNGIFKYTIEYPDKSFDELSKEVNINKVSADAFSSVHDEYIELMGFIDYLVTNLKGNSTSSSFEIVLTNRNIADDKTLENMDYFFNDVSNTLRIMRASGAITDGMTEREKALVFFEFIVSYKKYDTNFTPEGYTGFGLSQNNTGVCQSYVAMFHTFLKLEGIQTEGVSGIYNQGDHIWSGTTLDGEYVYIDITNADPIPDKLGYIDYKYFDISEAELRKTHTF